MLFEIIEKTDNTMIGYLMDDEQGNRRLDIINPLSIDSKITWSEKGSLIEIYLINDKNC